jgi:periplasmic protein TonB
MAPRNSSSRNAAPANPLMKFLPIIVILIGVGIAAYFFFPRGSNAPTPGTAPAPGAAATAPQPTAAGAPAAPAPELSREQLIKEAGTAMRESRLISPAGNNAVEFYLKVLEKDPNNNTAKDALREMFPIVTPVIEQNINAGQVDESLREIDTLAKADPSNYTLTILRSKLDAKKKQVDNEQKTAAAAAAAAAAKAAAAAATPAAPTAAAPGAATPATATPTPAPAPATTAATPAAPRPATVTPTAPDATAATPAPAAGGETHAAELIKSVPPEYPRDAYIKHLEGWVEVEFTVTPAGQVAGATVAGANPARIFNDAALHAVQRWTFKPRMDNGKAVEEHIKRRIEFKLSA